MHLEDFINRIDRALEQKLHKPEALPPTVAIRILAPVIQKYLDAGLDYEVIADVLRENGLEVTKKQVAINVARFGKRRDHAEQSADAVISA